MSKNKIIAFKKPEEISSDPLTELLRIGARRLIADAVESAELQELLSKHAAVRSIGGHQQIVRNGYLPEREIQTGIGPVKIRVPKIRDKSGQGIKFNSVLLPPYLRKTRSVEEVLPWLYLKGISTGDFQEALQALLGNDAKGLSASTISRCKRVWEEEHETWSRRILENKRYVYIWADGVYFNLRSDDSRQCILVITTHREQDRTQTDHDVVVREEQYVNTLQKRARKIREWLKDNDDKPGKTGKPKKSNITDNESAKMKTSHGVIQGYDGVTTVDGKHQIIVHAEAFGEAQEHDLLRPMVEGTRKNFQVIGKNEDVFTEAKLSADSGFHTEENMKMLFTAEVDAYVADNLFRKRDPRFVGADRYKERHREERVKLTGRKGLFSSADFVFPEDLSHCLCPAGKRMYRSGNDVVVGNFLATKFKGPKSACLPCKLRAQCLRHPDRTEIRQVAYFHGRSAKGKETFTEKMKHKIDSTAGRALYSLRVAIAEPPFAHICRIMGLDRFTLRGKKKVNIQWNLFCIVHNLKKVARYGPQFA